MVTHAPIVGEEENTLLNRKRERRGEKQVEEYPTGAIATLGSFREPDPAEEPSRLDPPCLRTSFKEHSFSTEYGIQQQAYHRLTAATRRLSNVMSCPVPPPRGLPVGFTFPFPAPAEED